MIRAKIIATGRYLPEKIVTNEDFIREFGNKVSPRALERLLGTREHRIAADDENCSDLLVKAAKNILKKADVSPKKLTQIIVSITPGDFIEPATACMVQHKLGAECPAMDIRLSCTGWLRGVDIAARHIATSDRTERILVLAGALVNRITPFCIVQHRAIFGDGAGGILLESSQEGEEGCIYGSEFVSLGEYVNVIYWPAYWTPHPKSTPEEFKGYFYMGENYPGETRLLFELADKVLPPFIQALWENTGLKIDDVDFAIVHQPTEPLFKKALECLGLSSLPSKKLSRNYALYGNTVSAELPISLDEAVENGQIQRGDTLLLISYGAGITIGGMLLRY